MWRLKYEKNSDKKVCAGFECFYQSQDNPNVLFTQRPISVYIL